MPVSDETRRKLSEARRLWWERATPEQRAAFKKNQSGPRPATSAALKGKPKPPREPRYQIVPCDQCGQPVKKWPYQLQALPHHFCSRACAGAYNGAAKSTPWPIVTCLSCGKEFQRQPSRAKYNNGHHYCSRPCADAARTGEKSLLWAGGRHMHADGYVLVNKAHVPEAFHSMLIHGNDRMLEHRLVMAMHLGRPLEPHEVVHHKNGVRDDNRIENLEMHSRHAHDGITNADRKDVAALRRRIRELEQEVAMLKADAP